MALTMGFLILLGAAAAQASHASKSVRASGAPTCASCVPLVVAEVEAVPQSTIADVHLDGTGRFGFHGEQHALSPRQPGNPDQESDTAFSALAGRDLRFYTDGQSRMVIDESGSVGIGTADPSPLYRLSVNGGIRAKEIVVETGWADYVFQDGYDLWSLHDIQAYIERNGHLPEIPSAAEVVAHGVSLGEMDARLLRKIEEMTLHLISFDSRLGELEADTHLPVQGIDADCAAPATAEER